MIENAINIDWQSLATLTIVFAALAGLARRAYGLFASKSVKGCVSGCSGCPSNNAAGATPALVQLEMGRSRSAR